MALPTLSRLHTPISQVHFFLMQYFKNAGWQDEWIERAEEIVRTEFDLSYGSMDTTSGETRLPKSKVCAPKLSSYIKSHCLL
jgi:hypothetical protein